jgi:hypothetical protein
MKSEIKNVHSDAITLFAMINGVEKQVTIPAGDAIIVDTYDTKTIRVFRQRGFITMEPAQLMESVSFSLISDEVVESSEDVVTTTFDSTSDSNNDEPMDHFHTTENTIVVDVPEMIITGDLDRLEVVNGQVEQYVEAGFIKGEWTEEDIQFLKKHYPTKGRKYCATHLNRNESSVQKKINALGIKKKKKKTK